MMGARGGWMGEREDRGLYSARQQARVSSSSFGCALVCC